MPAPYRIEPLGPQHERKGFTSGVPALDRYFQEQVTQDIRRLATSCYVACDMPRDLWPVTTRSPPEAFRWPNCLSRSANDCRGIHLFRSRGWADSPSIRRTAGRQLGATLLWDAVIRARRSELAVFAMAVDAKDDQAESFYRHHGFVSFGSAPRQLFLSFLGLALPAQP